MFYVLIQSRVGQLSFEILIWDEADPVWYPIPFDMPALEAVWDVTVKGSGATQSIKEPSHKVYISLWSKFCKNMCENTDEFRSQFYTCHDSWAVVTCANLWPDWIIRIEIRASWIFTRFQWWAHRVFVKWFDSGGGHPQSKHHRNEAHYLRVSSGWSSIWHAV